MLMKTRSVDFHAVEPHQLKIDARLMNWARWVQPARQGWINPMFAQYRSKAWQWHRPEVRDPCDTLDAMKLEKAVCALPEPHKVAVRWAYVIKCSPAWPMRDLGVTNQGLMLYLRDARQMLVNRL